MMLNGSALNLEALNGGSGFSLIAATADWSSGYSFSAEGTIQADAKAAWNTDLSLIFGGERQVFASVSATVGAVSTFGGSRILAGAGAWTTGATFHAYITNIIYSSAGFDATAELTATPGADFADGAWSVEITATPVATKQGTIKGNWSSVSGFTAEGDVSRGVSGNWVVESDWWAEWTFTSNGVVYHEGYTNWGIDAVWGVTPYLVATFTNGSFQAAGGEMSATAFSYRAAKGSWAISTALEMEPVKIGFEGFSWTADTAFTAISTMNSILGCDMSATASWASAAVQRHAGHCSLDLTTSLGAIPWKQGRLKSNFMFSASMLGNGLRTAMPIANLVTDTVSTMGGGAVKRQGATSWVVPTTFTAVGTLDLAGNCGMSVGSSWATVETQQHTGQAVFDAGATLQANPLKHHRLESDFNIVAEMSGAGLRIAMTNVAMTAGTGWSVGAGSVKRQGSISWTTGASTLIAAAKVSIAPAPSERQFVITGFDRTFFLGTSSREFKVAA